MLLIDPEQPPAWKPLLTALKDREVLAWLPAAAPDLQDHSKAAKAEAWASAMSGTGHLVVCQASGEHLSVSDIVLRAAEALSAEVIFVILAGLELQPPDARLTLPSMVDLANRFNCHECLGLLGLCGAVLSAACPSGSVEVGDGLLRGILGHGRRFAARRTALARLRGLLPCRDGPNAADLLPQISRAMCAPFPATASFPGRPAKNKLEAALAIISSKPAPHPPPPDFSRGPTLQYQSLQATPSAAHPQGVKHLQQVGPARRFPHPPSPRRCSTARSCHAGSRWASGWEAAALAATGGGTACQDDRNDLEKRVSQDRHGQDNALLGEVCGAPDSPSTCLPLTTRAGRPRRPPDECKSLSAEVSRGGACSPGDVPWGLLVQYFKQTENIPLLAAGAETSLSGCWR